MLLIDSANYSVHTICASLKGRCMPEDSTFESGEEIAAQK